jgi:ferredoxin
MQHKICPYDMAYLLDHPKLMFWKKCPCCGYCEDECGENLLTFKEKEYNKLESIDTSEDYSEDLSQKTTSIS